MHGLFLFFLSNFRMFQQFPGSVPFGAPIVQEWVQQRRENIRPWTTFFNTSNIRKPPSVARLTKRVLANVEYFKSNYLFVYIGLVLYCLLVSPSSTLCELVYFCVLHVTYVCDDLLQNNITPSADCCVRQCWGWLPALLAPQGGTESEYHGERLASWSAIRSCGHLFSSCLLYSWSWRRTVLGIR